MVGSRSSCLGTFFGLCLLGCFLLPEFSLGSSLLLSQNLVNLDLLREGGEDKACHVGVISSIMGLSMALVSCKLGVHVRVKRKAQNALVLLVGAYFAEALLQSGLADDSRIVDAREKLSPFRAELQERVWQWGNELLVHEQDVHLRVVSNDRLFCVNKGLDDLRESNLCLVHLVDLLISLGFLLLVDHSRFLFCFFFFRIILSMICLYKLLAFFD